MVVPELHAKCSRGSYVASAVCCPDPVQRHHFGPAEMVTARVRGLFVSNLCALN